MKSNTQIIIIVVFLFAAVVGVFVFSGLIPLGEDSENTPRGTVVLWGTVPAASLAEALGEFAGTYQDFAIQYVEKSPETFDRDLLEALASGQGPDMFFLPDHLVLGYRNKIIPVPYASVPVETYKRNFVGAADIFLSQGGILALPISVDPMVMYYNRSLFDAKGVVYPPVYWDEFPALVPQLTETDQEGKILKSAVALGQFANIAHAKNIISALLGQSGNPIITERDGALISTLNNYPSKYDLGSILKFYTVFADPLSNLYSWNRSFPSSDAAFSADKVAIYFGFASELASLTAKNPNQNFVASPMPQIRGESFKLTSARVTGVAVSAFSRNLTTAFYAANLLSTGDFANKFARATGTVPVRRDLLTAVPTDGYSPVFYNSALYAKGWLDPSPEETDSIFRSMVEKTLSNTLSPEEAIRDADGRIWLLLAR